MQNDLDDEIRNLFLFLSSEKNSTNIEKIPIDQILFGIENYLYGMPEDTKNKLKRELSSASKEGLVGFDDFKLLWKSSFKVDYSYSIKDSTNQMFNIISDSLERDRLSEKITEKDMEKLIKQLGINYFTKEELTAKTKEIENANLNAFNLDKNKHLANFQMEDEDEVKQKKLNEWKASRLKEVAKELIDCVDLDDDGMVSRKDFEFLITEYLCDKS